jgi:methyl-accepting chemotaxis protein
MFKQMKLKTKLMVIGTLITVIPLLVITAIIYTRNKTMARVGETESTKLAYADLDHMAQNIYGTCQIQSEYINEQVVRSLSVAHKVLLSSNDVAEANETVAWDAVNQLSKTQSRVELPKFTVGGEWIGQNKDISKVSPIVDTVASLTGAVCTIFQRMNSTGDMLQICTNVQNENGTRAIGTYIPRINTNGEADPAVSAILQGQSYNGRAFVINKWYITAYEPLYDSKKAVIGMLFVGVPQESTNTIRQHIMSIKVGKTGYVYVLDSKGRYIVSQGGKRDGENVWEAKDASGTLFIQEICKKALTLKPGEIVEQRYPWKNEGDAAAREKVVRLMYFEPWDWVIGVGSYIDEFYEAKNQITSIGNQNSFILSIICGITMFGAGVIWWLLST